LASGSYPEAVTFYTKLIEHQPRLHTLYIGRAKAKFLAGDRTGAIEDLAYAKALNPEDRNSDAIRLQIEEGSSPIIFRGQQESFSLFNKSMACTIANDLKGAGLFLDQMKIIERTPTEINWLALRMIVGLLESNDVAAPSRDLEARLESFGGFDFQQSPLKYLERGFGAQSSGSITKVKEVFEILRAGARGPRASQLESTGFGCSVE
jgi:tetratricopeptide (TPR) repeat protein